MRISTSCALAASVALACEITTAPQPPGVAPGRTEYTVGDAGGRMLSSDGALLVQIAPGSGAPSTLGVAPVDPAALAASFAEHQVVAAYELGPSGSRFSPPVAVELDLARLPGVARDGGAPLLWRSEGADFVLVDGQTLVDDGPGGAFVVRGELPHFSTVVLTRGAEMQLSFSSADFVDVGQPLASSGRMAATAASKAMALSVVMRADPEYALAGNEQGRDFGALDGGAQTVDRAYDPVTCQYGGVGAFDLAAVFTGYTNVRNGRQTAPATVNREGDKRVLCHVPGGSDTKGGPGTAIGGAAQTLAVSQATVRAVVGQKFVLELEFRGRNGDQGLRFGDVLPGIVSPAAAATPAALGTATNVAVRPTGASLTLAGNGGVRVEYECLKVGETGLSFSATYHAPLDVTTKVTCIAPPPPEEGEGR